MSVSDSTFYYSIPHAAPCPPKDAISDLWTKISKDFPVHLLHGDGSMRKSLGSRFNVTQNEEMQSHVYLVSLETVEPQSTYSNLHHFVLPEDIDFDQSTLDESFKGARPVHHQAIAENCVPQDSKMKR